MSSVGVGAAHAAISLVITLTCFPPTIDAGSQQPRRQQAPAGSAARLASATGVLKVTTGHQGSVVFINGVRLGATNEKGELDLPHVIAGSFPVSVRTTGYADWNGPVVIAAHASRALNVTQQPTSDEATLHFQKGNDLRDKGKNKDAVAEYKQAIALRTSFAEARIAIARTLTTLQDFQESETQIQAALKLAGRTLVESQTVLANLRRAQGIVDESIIEYRKALRLARGNSFEAHIGLAIALNEQKKTDEAVKEYRIGIIQDMETEPILYYQLGEILEKAKRNKEAIEAYRNYLRLDPEGEFASAAESIIEQLKQNADKR
jgi:predicted Zn-dependent protease